MATFRQRGGRTTATVRMRGIEISRTFPTKRESERWATAVEMAIESATPDRPFDRGAWLEQKQAPVKTQTPAQEPEATALPTANSQVDDATDDTPDLPSPAWSLRRALEYYLEHETPLKKGFKQESDRIKAWLEAHDRARDLARKRLDRDLTKKEFQKLEVYLFRVTIGKIRLDRLRADDLHDYVELRQEQGLAPTTILNEINIIRALYSHANRRPKTDGKGGWGLALDHDLDRLALPAPPPHRDRRLQIGRPGRKGEEERILEALADQSDGFEMVTLIRILLDTGCRLSEIVGMTLRDIEQTEEGNCIRLRDSKNGRGRRVYLSRLGWGHVSELRSGIEETWSKSKGAAEQRLFTLSIHDIEYRWKRAIEASGIRDLHLHDLRHEALSRMAARGLSLGELMSQSGHRDPRSLARYLNTRGEEITRKLG